MIEISKLLTRLFQGMKNRRRAVWIALYALMLIIFLEAASALVFNTMVSPEKLHRFSKSKSVISSTSLRTTGRIPFT